MIKRYLCDVIDLFVKHQWQVSVVTTQSKGEATQLASDAALHYDLLVCSGGDGTLNEVVSGLVKDERHIPIGYLPAGTTNDFASSLHYLLGEEGGFSRILPITLEDEWLVPRRYLKLLADSTVFNHVIFVDRLDQNIATLERMDKGEWKIRSMNPATTGRHAPPYAQETPLGMYLLQQKKSRMVFLKDGSAATGGYAPYASRFTNGAYIHGVPVNVPRTAMIEYSWSLGTTPRSHMCVRNATSHAKFVFDWAPTERSLVVVIE